MIALFKSMKNKKIFFPILLDLIAGEEFQPKEIEVGIAKVVTGIFNHFEDAGEPLKNSDDKVIYSILVGYYGFLTNDGPVLIVYI